jgi:hypothetical protein
MPSRGVRVDSNGEPDGTHSKLPVLPPAGLVLHHQNHLLGHQCQRRRGDRGEGAE